MSTLTPYKPSAHTMPKHPVREHYDVCARCAWTPPSGQWGDVDYVCQSCDKHRPMRVHERLASIFDDGAYHLLAEDIASRDPLVFEDSISYKERILRAQTTSGVDEALLVAHGLYGGMPLCAAVFAFEFIGGSMGEVVGERFMQAVEYCVTHRVPLVVYVASGGARMQEGVWSLVQMARVTAAIERLRQHGVLYMTCLCHPTTGGVAASLAMIADWVICEPEAYVAFTGARVLGVQTNDQLSNPEDLLALGHIDAIVSRAHQKAYFQSRMQLLMR